MRRILSICLICIFATAVSAQYQKKEQDNDIIYSEEKVPHYDLPKLLESAEGKAITNVSDWTTIRRPQILSLFSNLIYGRIPQPAHPLQTKYDVVEIDHHFLGGKATQKKVSIKFENQKGKAAMQILIFIPNERDLPVPAFMMLSFHAPDSDEMQLSESRPGLLQNGIPIETLVDQGYALISVYHQDLVGHNESEFKQTIHQLFFDTGQSFPKAHEWGVLATISWSAMQVLDYVDQNAEIDAEKVVLLGHSKLGKATLWAAAQDQRFAIAISANSGCAGAALWRRKFGETLAKMSIFPHWLCTNSRKFINQEDDLPVDQHMLLALIAPRPVYVAISEDDLWADPRGEYLSAFHASKVYELFGKKGFNSNKSPTLNQSFINQEIGFHLRSGGHYISPYDWEQFIAFSNYHFKK